MNTDQVLLYARETLETKWHHQGRLVGVGIDCVGVISHIATRDGLEFNDYTQYSKHPNPTEFIQRLEQSGVLERHDRFEVGAIAVFWIRHRDEPTHIGLITDLGLLHANQSMGRVREHAMVQFWSERVHSLWRFKSWQR